jgi:hypothetical protein
VERTKDTEYHDQFCDGLIIELCSSSHIFHESIEAQQAISECHRGGGAVDAAALGSYFR